MLKRSIPACLLVLFLPAAVPVQTPLKEAFNKYFRIGAALNPGHFTENDMKWERIHPHPPQGGRIIRFYSIARANPNRHSVR
jgi:hypothetical protein